MISEPTTHAMTMPEKTQGEGENEQTGPQQAAATEQAEGDERQSSEAAVQRQRCRAATTCDVSSFQRALSIVCRGRQMKQRVGEGRSEAETAGEAATESSTTIRETAADVLVSDCLD
jgi:hypothetical protein